jgi:branched-chain amino acid transport system ATP-binding protein
VVGGFMILQTQGVTKRFGRLQALVNVDLEVKPGEIFGIAGPNGAGKSTLFNVIAGFYPPTSGQIVFNGQNITRLNSHQVCRRGIARTFQIPTTFHTLTVHQNIQVGATFGAGKKDHLDEIIHFLDLAEHAGALATNLDLYTTKMVMLAAALATDCKLLMLDEPLAGLSIVEINDFLAVVRRINAERNITVILIEHLLDMLVDVSSRMMILHNGGVIYTGAPEKITEDPKVIEVYLGEEESTHDT